MRESQRIAEQVRRAGRGEAWHGPALAELLDGLTAKQAAARPIAGWKSIWEIVLHAIAWQDFVCARLTGRSDARTITDADDWPAAPKPTPVAWRATRAKLTRSTNALAKAVAAFPDAKLDTPMRAGSPPAFLSLNGVVQHTVYHAGQVAALKRALGLAAVKSPH